MFLYLYRSTAIHYTFIAQPDMSQIDIVQSETDDRQDFIRPILQEIYTIVIIHFKAFSQELNLSILYTCALKTSCK